MRVHVSLLALIDSPTTSLYLKKTLATVICNMAKDPANLPTLARDGAVAILYREQNFSTKLKRQRVQVGSRW